MRLLHVPGLLWIHGGLQIFTLFLFTIAFALGTSLAKDFDYVCFSLRYYRVNANCSQMNQPHAIIGIILWVLVMIQPFWDSSITNTSKSTKPGGSNHMRTSTWGDSQSLLGSSTVVLDSCWQITRAVEQSLTECLPE